MGQEQIDNGGPAFPMPVGSDGGESGHFRLDEVVPGNKPELMGMTLRDYFAGQALMGFIANSSLVGILAKGFQPDPAAEAVYTIADAMLRARKAK